MTVRRRQRAKLNSVSGNALGGNSGNSDPMHRLRDVASAWRAPGLAEVHSSHPTDGRYARGHPLKSRVLGGGGPSGRERVPEAKPAPGLSLIAQIPENPAPRHRPPSSKGAGEDSGGCRSPAERESQLDSKPSRSHPKSFRQRFLFPTFYFSNPILPTSLNERVRENAQFKSVRKKWLE